MTNFNPLSLENKKILITGASSGIGRATAIYLSRLGAKIVLNGRNLERLNETEKQLEGNGHIVISFDLTDIDNLEKIFEVAIKDGEKLNGFVHCAGIPCVVPLRALSPNILSDCFKTDFFCFVELVRQYAKSKYSDGGSIVAISSVTSVKPVVAETAYSTAKAAINASVLSMATELSKKNIRINGILVGNVLTEMSEKSLKQYESKNLKDAEVAQSLIGRWGTPDDVAAASAFLISDMSAFTTASLLDVGGGIK